MFIVKWEIKCSECGRHDDHYPGDTSFSETREKAEWFKKVFLEGAGDDVLLKAKGEQLEINLLACFKEPLGTTLLENARHRAPTSCGLKVGEGVSNKTCSMVLQFTIEEVPVSGALSSGSAKVN
ncbi:MAG: hypothetical protein A3C88_01700 [Candidatus Yanofskybacteria bacterium RIFCSPHIGHO2_02_FULL_50_12]|uniref:Uncharacterized protein n=1 Tax=Candidatus Yanofskybacteria bacterium RIFCSPHIGHO2_02_FULL_50_12 TaxID=1802685 RepID=A0A1F8FU79_9BACT|nr:MAG: hypothetical protein A3C88_01700 [Candidatus Yanofskybacteria bacterium RIFCSPHIGHO2_02_FULL_50_12]